MLRLKDAAAHQELQKRVDARFKSTEKMPWLPVRGVVDAAMRAPPADALPVLTDAVVRNKYGNTKTGVYASKREAKRAFELRLMQDAGAIRGLKEKTRFLLVPTQHDEHFRLAERPCYYECDFEYEENTGTKWRRVVEDVKGVRTKEYIIKRKLMLFVHKITVREI
jgi:hypothetical protein